VGPGRDECCERLDSIITLWHKNRRNFSFPKTWKLAGPRLLGWYAPTPDALAQGYARKARAGEVPCLSDEDGDASQYCSSLIVATWQAAMGSMRPVITPEEENDLLGRIPMHSRRSMPTDWSILPRFSPHWEVVGIVTGFSGKRRFDWFKDSEQKAPDAYSGADAMEI